MDKHCFCFTHLNLRFPLTLTRVCSPFFSFQTIWRWIADGTAKWENDYTGREKEQNQSGSGSFFSCARGAGQLPGLVAKVTRSSANWCSGQRLKFKEGDGRMEGDDGWDIGRGERGWGSLNVSTECFKQRRVDTRYMGGSVYNPLQTAANPLNYSQLHHCCAASSIQCSVVEFWIKDKLFSPKDRHTNITYKQDFFFFFLQYSLRLAHYLQQKWAESDVWVNKNAGWCLETLYIPEQDSIKEDPLCPHMAPK